MWQRQTIIKDDAYMTMEVISASYYAKARK